MTTLRRIFTRPRNRPASCRDVGRVLQQFLDGELDEVRATKLGHHLEECRRCGLEAEVYDEIKARLSQRGVPVPEHAVARLRAFGEHLIERGHPAGDV